MKRLSTTTTRLLTMLMTFGVFQRSHVLEYFAMEGSHAGAPVRKLEKPDPSSKKEEPELMTTSEM